MMGKKFTLTINLGNEAMQTGEDVAEAVALAVYSIEQQEGPGRIYDANGNQVGEWGYSE